MINFARICCCVLLSDSPEAPALSPPLAIARLQEAGLDREGPLFILRDEEDRAVGRANAARGALIDLRGVEAEIGAILDHDATIRNLRFQRGAAWRSANAARIIMDALPYRKNSMQKALYQQAKSEWVQYRDLANSIDDRVANLQSNSASERDRRSLGSTREERLKSLSYRLDEMEATLQALASKYRELGNNDQVTEALDALRNSKEIKGAKLGPSIRIRRIVKSYKEMRKAHKAASPR